MPMYEFRCRDCGERFEELRSLSDPNEGIECPSCSGGRVEKLFSTFAAATGGGGTSSGASGSGSCGPRGFS